DFRVFYGQLTNLRYTIAVSDMAEPLQRTKVLANAPGDCGGEETLFLNASASSTDGISAAVAKRGACRADKQTLCLLNHRFEARLTWSNQFNGESGRGGATPLGDVAGGFY